MLLFLLYLCLTSTNWTNDWKIISTFHPPITQSPQTKGNLKVFTSWSEFQTNYILAWFSLKLHHNIRSLIALDFEVYEGLKGT